MWRDASITQALTNAVAGGIEIHAQGLLVPSANTSNFFVRGESGADRSGELQRPARLVREFSPRAR